jgi:hypothetical protein
MCDEWRRAFRCFVQDMGRRPSLKHGIERIDNDGDYEPGNCRWTTQAEQSKNRRNNIRITIGGETRILKDWTRHFRVPYKRAWRRIRKLGWSPERALEIVGAEE